MKKALFLLILLFSLNLILQANEQISKKVLFINSYHTGLAWSDGIHRGIVETLNKSTFPIEFKSIEMDTKRNQTEVYKKQAALKAKKVIENFNPDIVITSDDNAAKYLIVPYFYDSSLPFVFCGVNGSASKYGFPSKNVTGMIEVQLVPQLINTLKAYAKGTKVGYLKGESFSSRKEVIYFEEVLNQTIDKRFASSVKEWKEHFLDLQKRVDILLIGNGAAIKGWNESKQEVVDFVKNNTKIPAGSWDASASDLVVLTFANKAEEQGEWAAKTALTVLEGEDISKISLVKNKKAKVYINVTLGKKLKMVFPFELIDNAVVVQ